jgi:hypothetical protein
VKGIRYKRFAPLASRLLGIHANYRCLIYFVPGPYTSMQRSSKALTISLDTCPKNAAETVACTGFEKANARSSVTSVGPVLCSATDMACVSKIDGCWGK